MNYANIFNPPKIRLWGAALIFGFLMVAPAGYQMTYLNQPASLFMKWVHTATGGYRSKRMVTFMWSVIVSGRIAGSVIGYLTSPFLVDKVGRRDALRVSAILVVIGECLSFLAMHIDSVVCLLIGRMFSGIGDGVIMVSLWIFFAEVAPAAERGQIMVFLMFTLEIGMLLGMIIPKNSILGTVELLPFIFLPSAFMPLPVPVLFAWFPKSPRFLYTVKRDPDSALKSFQFYQGTCNELNSMQEAYCSAAETQPYHTLWNIWKDKQLRGSFCMALCFAVLIPFSGRAICLNYSTDLLRAFGLDNRAAETTALIAQAFGVPALVFTMLTADWLGRKPLFIASSVLVAICQFIVMVCYYVDNNTASAPLGVTFVGSLSIGLWIPILIGGITGLSFIPVELFPQRSRSAGYSIYLAVSYAIAAITTVIFKMLCSISRGMAVIFLMVPLVISTILVALYLPETSGRTMEDAGHPELDNNINMNERAKCINVRNYGATDRC